jgi:hypothetical protein
MPSVCCQRIAPVPLTAYTTAFSPVSYTLPSGPGAGYPHDSAVGRLKDRDASTYAGRAVDALDPVRMVFTAHEDVPARADGWGECGDTKALKKRAPVYRCRRGERRMPSARQRLLRTRASSRLLWCSSTTGRPPVAPRSATAPCFAGCHPAPATVARVSVDLRDAVRSQPHSSTATALLGPVRRRRADADVARMLTAC